MRFGLIVIGDEILSGKRQDAHLPKVVELLSARGLALAWAEYVGDDRPRIVQTIKRAIDSGDIVFSCGGIGATPDDHTRQAAAEALGRELVLHPQARELIIERIRDMEGKGGAPYDPAHPDTVHRMNMGVFPEGAQIIPNPYNKIPGFSVGELHFVPGFPVMAHPMIESLLDGRYAALHGSLQSTERSVVVFGAMEATLTPLMLRLEAEHPGVRVFSLPSVDHPQWGRHVELGVKGPSTEATRAFAAMSSELHRMGVKLGPEIVR
jgi:molybdopterin-biosynthesis enzyme MoeA-like protein